MKCPTDNVTLLIAEKQGVEIDYCPDCRGVWLDRGELDKLMVAEERRYDAPPSRQPAYDDDDDYHSRGSHGYPKSRKKKKSSFLGEIFDF